MSHSAPVSPADENLTHQKLRLETAKLQAEIRSLRKPNLTVWFTALVGLLGIGLQYIRSNREYELATIRKEKTELDQIKLESLRQLTASRVDSLLARGSQAQKYLDSLRGEVKNAGDQLTQLAKAASTQAPDQAAIQATLGRARQQLGQIGTHLEQTKIASAKSRDTLQAIRAELETVGGLSPGSPVIARITVPYRADLTYRRWISKEKVVPVGTVGPGETKLQLPYGGYIYFNARNLQTGQSFEQGIDCRAGCELKF